MNKSFQNIAAQTSRMVGSSWAFILALATVALWAVTGPLFNYSDTWLLIINTITTIVTFLVVFLIQNTQNRESKAIHLQLSELIRAVKSARNELIDLEDLSDQEMENFHQQFRKLEQIHLEMCRKNKNCPFKD